MSAKKGHAPRMSTFRPFPLAHGMSHPYWLSSVRANSLINYRSETFPKTAEVVVIGSGLAGCLTALELLKSGHQSVVIVEAREFCSGATGRSGGHCKPDHYKSYAKQVAFNGADQAIKILNNEYDTFNKLTKFVKDGNVDCELWIGETYEVHMSKKLSESSLKEYHDYVAAGGDVSMMRLILDPEEAEKVTGLRGAQSVFAWPGATFHPWKLVAHIANKALDLGLNLQTWTPATEVIESSGLWDVVTPRGTISTTNVVHATNAYASALLPEFRGVINPTPHMIMQVTPPSAYSGANALSGSMSVFFDNSSYSINPRQGGDGNLLFGGWNPGQPKLITYTNEDPSHGVDDGIDDFPPVAQGVEDLLRDSFNWYDGGYGSTPKISAQWSGVIGRVPDIVSIVGAVPRKKGQWICAGHNGHGLARIFTQAPALVKLINGASWGETGLPECFEITQERLDKLVACGFHWKH